MYRLELAGSAITFLRNAVDIYCIRPVPIALEAEGLSLVGGVNGWTEEPLDILLALQERSWVLSEIPNQFGYITVEFEIGVGGTVQTNDPLLKMVGAPITIQVNGEGAPKRFKVMFSFCPAKGGNAELPYFDNHKNVKSNVVIANTPSNQVIDFVYEGDTLLAKYSGKYTKVNDFIVLGYGEDQFNSDRFIRDLTEIAMSKLGVKQ